MNSSCIGEPRFTSTRVETILPSEEQQARRVRFTSTRVETIVLASVLPLSLPIHLHACGDNAGGTAPPCFLVRFTSTRVETMLIVLLLFL